MIPTASVNYFLNTSIRGTAQLSSWFVGLIAAARTGTVTNATNTAPIVVSSTAHGLASGDTVHISGVQGNTSANGTWVVSKIDADSFSLNGSVGNAAYTTGGSFSTPAKLAAADTMTSKGWTESTAYSEATRPQWSPGAASAGALSNSADLVFTANANVTWWGYFIVSNSTKGGTAGTLLDMVLFDLPEVMISGETFKLRKHEMKGIASGA